MIVATSDLARLAAGVTMVDGGFDPLHAGHVRYFRAAAELGLPVLCNVTTDDWVARKHPPLLPQVDRGEILDAIRWLEYVHLASSSTAAVLRELRPRHYAKGIDWEGKLPEEELRICDENGIDVVFLDTVIGSSTAILDRYDGRRHG